MDPYQNYRPCAFLLCILLLPNIICLEDSMLEPVTFYWAELKVTYTDPETHQSQTSWYKGKFGLQSLVASRTGLLVHARTTNNKTDGCEEYGHKVPTESWIALVERGMCFFNRKITVATRVHNASAVLIYNNSDGRQLSVMRHQVNDQVSVFVTRDTGTTLASLVDKGFRVMLTITPGENDKTKSEKHIGEKTLQTSTVIMVSVPIILFCLIVFVVIIHFLLFARRRRRRCASEPAVAYTEGQGEDHGGPSVGETLIVDCDVKT